jgi:hypothetical protein
MGKKKKGFFIWIANISKNPEHALVSIKLWCKYFANIELMDTLIVTGSDQGEGARTRKEFLEKAYQIGSSLDNELS